MDSATVLFLEHNVCFRETDPLNGRAYLVFPELINLKKPVVEDDDPTRRRRGLHGKRLGRERVCLAGGADGLHTDVYAHEPVAEPGPLRGGQRGFVCGFRQEEERAGELDFVLYFGTKTSPPRCGPCSRACSRAFWPAGT